MEKFLYELNFRKMNCLKLDHVDAFFDMVHSVRELTLDEVKTFAPFILNGTLVYKGPEDKNPQSLFADELTEINGKIQKRQEDLENDLKESTKLKEENTFLNEEILKVREELLSKTEEAAKLTKELAKKDTAIEKLKAENKELADSLKGK